jgi:tetratricopeptide (TPR) repeat protein
MISRKAGLIVLVCLLVPSLAAAQDSAPTKSASQAAPMQEEIEIFRRILIGKLHELYGRTTPLATYREDYQDSNKWYQDNNNWSQPSLVDYERAAPNTWKNSILVDRIPGHGSHGISGEGVYLKGHGVVYSFTLPPPPQAPKAEDFGPSAKPLSDWERARKQVRGEKVTEETGTVRRDKNIITVLLKALAENGQHFTQLPENESVTIAITFREGSSNWSADSDGNFEPRLGVSTFNNQGSSPYPGFSNKSLAPADPATSQPSQPAASLPQGYSDNVLLGDLHLKQGRAQEAVAAYLKALELLDSEKADPALLTSLFQKLAQAQLANGKVDEAKKWLDKASALPAQYLKQVTKDAPSSLPSKLIVSASKKLLDQVGSGKLSFDEFRKQVTLDYYGTITLDHFGLIDSVKKAGN